MNKSSKDKPIAALTIRSVRELSPKNIKNIAAWLREQAQFVELHSHELANTYSAKYWRSKNERRTR